MSGSPPAAAISSTGPASPSPAPTSASKPKGLSSFAQMAAQLQHAPSDSEGDSDGGAAADDDRYAQPTEDNSAFATADYDAGQPPQPTYEPEPRRPVSHSRPYRPRHSQPAAAAPSPPPAVAAKSTAGGWLNTLRNALPLGLQAVVAPAAVDRRQVADSSDSSEDEAPRSRGGSRNARGSSSSSSRRPAAVFDEQQAVIFSNNLSLDDHIHGSDADAGGSKKAAAIAAVAVKVKAKPNNGANAAAPQQQQTRRPAQRATTGSSSSSSGARSRSRSSSAQRHPRMPLVAEEPSEEDSGSPRGTAGVGAGARSTSVSNGSSADTSRVSTRPQSPLVSNAAGAAIVLSTVDDDSVADDPLAKSRLRARDPTRLDGGAKDEDAPRLGAEDDSSAAAAAARNRAKYPSTAPKPSPRVKPGSKPASASSPAPKSATAESPRSNSAAASSTPSAVRDAFSSTAAGRTPSGSPSATRAEADGDDEDDDPTASRFLADEAEEGTPFATNHSLPPPSSSASLSRSNSEADPLGFKTSSASTPTAASATAASSSSMDSSALAAAARPRRKKKSRSSAARSKLIPVSSWANMPLELVVRDALLSRRIVEALVHLKERLMLRAKVARENDLIAASKSGAGGAALNSAAAPPYHLINPVPLFRLLAGQLLFQMLNMDHLGSDLLTCSGWVLRMYREDVYAYFKRVLWEVTRRGLRLKIMRHFAHMDPETFKQIREGTIGGGGASASAAAASSASSSASSSSAASALLGPAGADSSLFSSETSFESSLEFALWNEEESRRKAKQERIEQARLASGSKPNKDVLDKERERARDADLLAKETRDSYEKTAAASRPPTASYFTAQALAQDSFLYECMRVLEHAYPSPSFVATYARAATAALTRQEAESAVQRALVRRHAEDARGAFLKGKRLRASTAKHGPDEFPMVRHRGAGADSSASPLKARQRPQSLRTGSSGSSIDQPSPLASNASPGSLRGRADSKASTSSISATLPMHRSISGPDSSASSIAPPTAALRSRSGVADDESGDVSALAASLSSAAVVSLTVHPWLGPIDGDVAPTAPAAMSTPLPLHGASSAGRSSVAVVPSSAGGAHAERVRHPDFLTSSDEDESDSDSDGSADEAKTSAAGGPQRRDAGSDSDSSSASSDSEAEEAAAGMGLWIPGEVEDLRNPLFRTLSLPLSTEDAAASSGTGTHTPIEGMDSAGMGAASLAAYLLQGGRNGQIRGLTRSHFAPLNLQGAESHPLDPSYKGESKQHAHGHGADDDSEDGGDDEDGSEEEEEEKSAAQIEREQAIQEEKDRSRAADSCVKCRMDNEVSRQSCSHDGYLNLSMLSLSRWSLRQFYLVLLDKSAEFAPQPVHINASRLGVSTAGSAPAFSASTANTPLDMNLLVQQVAEWIVAKQVALEREAQRESPVLYATRVRAELVRQKLILAETRLAYLLAANDWRRAVAFIEKLPIDSASSSVARDASRVSELGHLVLKPLPSKLVFSADEDVNALYHQLLLRSLPAMLQKWMPSASAWTQELVAVELARHGLFMPADLPPAALPKQLDALLDAPSAVQVATRMDFQPLLRRLAHTGMLFRSATAADRAALLRQDPSSRENRVPRALHRPNSFRAVRDGPRSMDHRAIYRARTYNDHVLAGLDPSDARLHDAESDEARANTAQASLEALLPFERLSPFHVWFLQFCYTHNLVPILSCYLSHYRLHDFAMPAAADAAAGSAPVSSPLKSFRGWSGIELYLRQGELYKAALMNCNTFLVSLGVVSGGSGAPKAGAAPSILQLSKANKSKAVASTAAAASSSASPVDLDGTAGFATASVPASSSSSSSSASSSKAKDPSHTVFMQNLFERGLHLMALSTLMYYPTPTASAKPDASKSIHATEKATRSSSKPKQRTLKTKASRKQAAAASKAKSGASSSSSSSAFVRDRSLPSYIIQSSATSSLFFSPSRRRTAASSSIPRRRLIDFTAADRLPLQWFFVTSRGERRATFRFLPLLTSSPSRLPALSSLHAQPSVLPFRSLGAYLVQFKELSLALYSIHKQKRDQQIEKEEVTTGNLYAWRKEAGVSGDAATTAAGSSPDPASSYEGFGSLQQQIRFQDDISLYDMLTNLVGRQAPRISSKEQTKATAPGSAKKTAGRKVTTSSESSKLSAEPRVVDPSILLLFDNPAFTIELISERRQADALALLVADDSSLALASDSGPSSSNATPMMLAAAPGKRDQLLLELTGDTFGDDNADDLLGVAAPDVPAAVSEDDESSQPASARRAAKNGSTAALASMDSDAPPALPVEHSDSKKSSRRSSGLADLSSAMSAALAGSHVVDTPVRPLLDVFPPFPPRLPHFSHPALSQYGDQHQLTYDYFLRKAQPLKAFDVYLRTRGLEMNGQKQLIMRDSKRAVDASSVEMAAEKESLFNAVLALALRHLLDVRVKVSCVIFLHLCGIRAHLLRTMIATAYRVYRVWMKYLLGNAPGSSAAAAAAVAARTGGTSNATGNIAALHLHSGFRSRSDSLGSVGSIGSLGSGELRIPFFHAEIQLDADRMHADAMESDDEDHAGVLSDNDDLELRVHEDQPWAKSAGARSGAISPMPAAAATASSAPAIPAVASLQPALPSELEQAMLSNVQHLLLPLVSVLAAPTLIVPAQYHTAFKALYDATMFLMQGKDREPASSASVASPQSDAHESLKPSLLGDDLTDFDRFFEADASLWVLPLRFQQAFHQPLTTFPHHLLTMNLQELSAATDDSASTPQRVELAKAFSIDRVLGQADALHIGVDELIRLLSHEEQSIESFDRAYGNDLRARTTDGAPSSRLTAADASRLPFRVSTATAPSADAPRSSYSWFLHCMPQDLFCKPRSPATSSLQQFVPNSALDAGSRAALTKALLFARLLMGQQQQATLESKSRAASSSASEAPGALSTLAFLSHVAATYPCVDAQDAAFVPGPVLKSLLSIVHQLQHLSDVDVLLAASRSATAWPHWNAQLGQAHPEQPINKPNTNDSVHQTSERLLQLCRLTGHPLLSLLSFASPVLQQGAPAQKAAVSKVVAAAGDSGASPLLQCVYVYLYLLTTQSMDLVKVQHEKQMAAKRRAKEARMAVRRASHSSSSSSIASQRQRGASTTRGSRSRSARGSTTAAASSRDPSSLLSSPNTSSGANLDEESFSHFDDESKQDADTSVLGGNESASASSGRHGAGHHSRFDANRQDGDDVLDLDESDGESMDEENDARAESTSAPSQQPAVASPPQQRPQQQPEQPRSSPLPLSASPLLLRYFESGSLHAGEFRYLLLDYLIHPLLPAPYAHRSLRYLLLNALQLFAPTSPIMPLVQFAVLVQQRSYDAAGVQLARFVRELTAAIAEERRERERKSALFASAAPADSSRSALLSCLDMFEVSALFLQHLLDGKYYNANVESDAAAEAEASSSAASSGAVLPYRRSTLPTPPSLLTSPFTPPLRLPKLTQRAFTHAFVLRLLKSSGYWSLHQDVLMREYLSDLRLRATKATSQLQGSTPSKSASGANVAAADDPLTQFPALVSLYPSFLVLCRRRLNDLLAIFEHSLTHTNTQHVSASAAVNGVLGSDQLTSAAAMPSQASLTHRIRASVPFHLREVHAGLRSAERSVTSMQQLLEKLNPKPAPAVVTEVIKASEPVSVPEAKPVESVAAASAAKSPPAVAAVPAAASTELSARQSGRSRFTCVPYRLYQTAPAAEVKKTPAQLAAAAAAVAATKALVTVAATASSRTAEIERQQQAALAKANEQAAVTSAASPPVASPAPVTAAVAPPSILAELERSLAELQSSFLWQFTLERMSFWRECHEKLLSVSVGGSGVGAASNSSFLDERDFFVSQLTNLRGQLSLQEKEEMLRYIEQARTQQQEQERLAASMVVAGSSSSSSPSAASPSASRSRLSEEEFQRLMTSILKQAIVPPRKVPTAAAAAVATVAASPSPSASPSTTAASPSSADAASPAPSASPSTAAGPASPKPAELPSYPVASPRSVESAPVLEEAPLCLLHNASCPLRSFVSASSPSVLSSMPVSSLPSFGLFVAPRVPMSVGEDADEEDDQNGLSESSGLLGSQTYAAQVWPPLAPRSVRTVAVGSKATAAASLSPVWCGCGVAREAPSVTSGGLAYWLDIPASSVRYGVYMNSLYNIGLGDLVVGRCFQSMTGAGSNSTGGNAAAAASVAVGRAAAGGFFDFSAARALVMQFESVAGYKSRDLQLLDIAQIVVAHVLGSARDPAPYPRLPKHGVHVICKHNAMLEATVPDSAAPASSSKDGKKSSSAAVQKTLSPHVHRSLILEALTAVSWFGRNIALKLHVLFDLAELLQSSFQEMFEMQSGAGPSSKAVANSAASAARGSSSSSSSSAATGLRKLMDLILHASMLHRQRDREKFDKKLAVLRRDFFDNVEAQRAEREKDSAGKAASPSPSSPSQELSPPELVWFEIERLERVKELHREVGRLHPYTEMFLRVVQCYELTAAPVADVVSDVLMPYVCQAIKECQPAAQFMVQVRVVAPTPVAVAEPAIPAIVSVPVMVASENILSSGYETLEAISAPEGSSDHAAGASGSSTGVLPLTADSDETELTGESAPEALEDDGSGILQPRASTHKKKLVVVPRAVALQLKAKKQEKVAARAREEARLAAVKHAAHIDGLAERRVLMQREALERRRANERLVEEEKWWMLFIRNLAVAVAPPTPTLVPAAPSSSSVSSSSSKPSGLRGSSASFSSQDELATCFLKMSLQFAAATSALPLSVEAAELVRQRQKASEANAAAASFSSSSATVAPLHTARSSKQAVGTVSTHSYQDAQHESVALVLAYKFYIASLHSAGVNSVVSACALRLPFLILLHESGVRQPLEIVLRGILVFEYSALRLLFAHAANGLGLEVHGLPFAAAAASASSASSSSSSSRAGLHFLQDCARSLVSSDLLHFQTHLQRFLVSDVWSPEAMVSLPAATSAAASSEDWSSNAQSASEESYLAFCRFFGFYALQAHHFLRGVMVALGDALCAEIRRAINEAVQGAQQDPASAAAADASASADEASDDPDSRLSPAFLSALRSSFSLLSTSSPPVPHLHYAQNALLTARQYLRYVHSEQAQMEVDAMLTYVEFALASPQ